MSKSIKPIAKQNSAKPTTISPVSKTNLNGPRPSAPPQQGPPPVLQGSKLQPEGKVTTTSGKFDCVCFLVHCAEHDRILVTKQDGAVWMPYAQMPPHRSWKLGALFGLCLCLTGSNTSKFNTLKSNPPYIEMKNMQMLRVQLPQSLKFVKRMIYYFKLKPNADNFKCCQSIASHLDWLPLEEVKAGNIPQLWGPELVEFAQLVPGTIKQRIEEFSLEEACLFVPRDPPQNVEEELLLSLRITGNEVERLYADFLEHCFPSLYQTENSFKHYLSKYDFEKDDARLGRLFKAFNWTNNGFLSFHQLLLGLACLEPNSRHGEFRAKFIFRCYDTDMSGGLCMDEMRALVADMSPNHTPAQVEMKLKEIMANVATNLINSRQEVAEKDFVAAVGAQRIRGTSVLCRSAKPIFAQIARSIALKSLYNHKTGCNKVLSNVLTKAEDNGVCSSCKTKKYEVATHKVVIDMNGHQRSHRLTQIPVLDSPNQKNQRITAQQYSLECVFKQCSVANVTMKLLREFNEQKGTTEQPKGLLWDRKAEMWKLLNFLYIEIDVLLEQEYKCQKVYSPCYIIGDIHGNLEDLMSMEKALWKQMPCVAANYVFLGDYVDRGKWGLECALYLMAFKLLCPNKVTMLRGNHEVRSLQKHYSYYKECILKYGEVMGLGVFELTNKIFDKLPVCATVDDAIFCAHGGIPRSAQSTEQIRQNVPRQLSSPERQSAIAWEILWSDPCRMQQFMDICDQKNLDPDAQAGYIFNVKRGTAFLFSESGATGFLRNNSLTHIIRAHEVAPPGFVFHFGSKCVTIFSCSHYCGNDNECGLILADNQRLRVIILDTVNNASATD